MGVDRFTTYEFATFFEEYRLLFLTHEINRCEDLSKKRSPKQARQKEKEDGEGEEDGRDQALLRAEGRDHARGRTTDHDRRAPRVRENGPRGLQEARRALRRAARGRARSLVERDRPKIVVPPNDEFGALTKFNPC